MSFGWAWLAATIALALHVADEATHDFLASYNPRALRMRRFFGGLPFPPTFTFWPWLIGLMAAVLVLAALTPSAFAGARWLVSVAYFLAVVHMANGMLHLGASIAARRSVPGVLSAPLLLVSGIWLASAAAHLP
ncbi:MAG TPA: HXXEE domain-containing protein [Gemmatimonadales bacterium]|nr:HXXEE domain-containing protein [Gemmatimonadales bacterium]